MGNREKVSSENLLSCFFGLCESRFRFLESEGFLYISGYAEHKDGRQTIRSLNGQTIDTNRAASLITRYERPDLALEIVYKPEEARLDYYLCYGHAHRLQLLEALKVKRKKPPPAMTALIAAQKPMEKSIEAASTALYKNRDWLLDPDAKFIEKALTQQEILQEHQIRKHHKESLKEAGKKAAKAYLQKDYKRVIELLTPYKPYLATADLKKLEQARKKLLG